MWLDITRSAISSRAAADVAPRANGGFCSWVRLPASSISHAAPWTSPTFGLASSTAACLLRAVGASASSEPRKPMYSPAAPATQTFSTSGMPTFSCQT